MPFLVLVSMLGLVLTYHIRSIYLGLFLVLLSILLFSAVTFVSNYLAARKHRLPILVVSGTWQNPVSYLLDPLLSPILAGDHFGWELMTRYSRQCWALRYNGWIHGKHGPAIALVSAANNEIMVDDPAAAKMVISKWTTWVKKPTLYRVSDVFGPKVTSVNDPTWRRHRKISTVAFTAERNYGAVWDASVVQVEGMAAKWMRRGEMTIKDVASDARVLALHVLSAAAFGHPVHSFEDGEQNPPAGRQMTFHTAIAIITDNILTTMLFAAPSLPRWLPLPSILRELVVAVNEVKAYMAEEVQETKEAVRRGEFDKRPPNLMSALVQASELAKRENGGGGGKEEKTGKTASARGGVAGGLSDDELYADLFDLSRAGYETTASTLSFAIPYLAAFDDVQDWLREEIDEVFGSLNLDEGSHLAIGKYREVFPRLKRCRAVMVRNNQRSPPFFCPSPFLLSSSLLNSPDPCPPLSFIPAELTFSITASTKPSGSTALCKPSRHTRATTSSRNYSLSP